MDDEKCLFCGEIAHYDPPHEADDECGIPAWPGGLYCTGCGARKMPPMDTEYDDQIGEEIPDTPRNRLIAGWGGEGWSAGPGEEDASDE